MKNFNIKKYVLFTIGSVLSVWIVLATIQNVRGQEPRPGVHLGPFLADMTPSDMTAIEQIQKMEVSQTAWMDYCLKEASAADRSEWCAQANREMLDALQTEGNLEAKIWLLQLLGLTGTDQEVSSLAVFLDSSEIRLANAAMGALLEIGSPLALDALRDAAKSVTMPGRQEALLATLDQNHPSLVVPQETELPMALPGLEEAAVQEYIANNATLSIDDQVRTLAALTVRKDPALRPLALAALSSDQDELVFAGFFALEKSGNPDDILQLTRFFGTPWEQQATSVMTTFPGKELDLALVDQLRDPKYPFLVQLARIAAARNAKEALPCLLDLATADSCPDRVSLLTSAALLAVSTDIPRFVESLVRTSDAKERDEIEKLISRLSAGNGSFVVACLNDGNAASLLPLLGRIGGRDSLERLRAIVTAPGPNERKIFAVRGLCNWPDAEVASDLLALATSRDLSDSVRVPALRAYIRVMTLPDEQIGRPTTNEERLDALRTAMTWSSDNREKELILRRAGSVRSPRTLAFILEFVDDPALTAAVFDSILELAHHDFLRKSAPNEFRGALDLILNGASTPEQKDRAQRYRNALPAPAPDTTASDVPVPDTTETPMPAAP